MRRTLLVALILSCGLSRTDAQTISIGPDLGLSILHLGNTNTGNDFQLGVHGGAQFVYQANENFSLKSGLYFSQKKQRYQADTSASLLDEFGDLLALIGVGPDVLNIPGIRLDVNERTRGVASTYYIELPVVASYHVDNFNFFAGPTVGVMVANRNKEEITTTIPLIELIDLDSLLPGSGFSALLPQAESTSSDQYNSTENLARWDVGMSAGIGYTRDQLNLNFSFNQSFLDYRDEPGADERRTHRSFRVSLAYLFPVKPAQ